MLSKECGFALQTIFQLGSTDSVVMKFPFDRATGQRKPAPKLCIVVMKGEKKVGEILIKTPDSKSIPSIGTR